MPGLVAAVSVASSTQQHVTFYSLCGAALHWLVTCHAVGREVISALPTLLLPSPPLAHLGTTIASLSTTLSPIFTRED